jgi:hypothetical protein
MWTVDLHDQTVKAVKGVCSNGGFRELALVELIVEAPVLHELAVVALFDDASVIHDDDDVGLADRGEPVGDDEARPTLAQSGPRLVPPFRGLGAHRAQTTIKDRLPSELRTLLRLRANTPWSGWGDLNSRSLGPQPSALDQTKPQPVRGRS